MCACHTRVVLNRFADVCQKLAVIVPFQPFRSDQSKYFRLMSKILNLLAHA